MDWLRKYFDQSEREIAKYRARVDAINDLEPEVEKLPDAELRAKTADLKERVQSGWQATMDTMDLSLATDNEVRDRTRKALDDVLDAMLPEAFAVAREARRRTIGQRHYDVQLIGGMGTHD